MKIKIKIKKDTGIVFFMIFPPENVISLLNKMIFYPPDKMILYAPVF